LYRGARMRTRLSLSLVTLCLLALTSARVSGQAATAARKSYDAAVREAKRNFLKCDAEALDSTLMEDYTGVNAEGHVTKGRAAALQADREFCAANRVTAWDATTTDFHSSGPIAWAAGTLRMTIIPKATGKSETHELHFLATYVRGPHDTWRQQYFMSVPVASRSR
ncbi:MAG TPA: DUF4440 domain-containing protein, partial [Acidobacteriaceae bacterium]|nr:DUF4440 domain-containing protein [Acidobacteriaceae bacterium]